MVSIIVPVYNLESYLPRCVESLLGQTCPDVEVILVDDGSTDGSAALCDAYAGKDSRVRVFHKENGGQSSARNVGLDAARGAWLLFVDGDDYLADDAVEQLLKAADSLPQTPDIVHFHYTEVADGTYIPEQKPGKWETEDTVLGHFERMYAYGGMGASPCTKLYRRTLFDGLRFREGTIYEDEDLMTELWQRTGPVLHTDLVLYMYVMRQGSTVHGDFQPKTMQVFPVLERRVAALESLGFDALVLQTKARMFQTAAWQYCLARRSGFREEAAALKKRVCGLAKVPGLVLSGQYKVLYRGARVSPAAVDTYYFIRRLCGKS